MDILLIQLKPISEDYKLFGSVAGIASNTMDEIVASSIAPYNKLVEVCVAWLDKCHIENVTPTWRAVSEFLSLMGQTELSRDIMQVYESGN